MDLKYKNITESTLLKAGQGIVSKIIINSHTSGTVKLIDGLSDGVLASGTLTSTGAMVPGSHAESVVTADAIVDGNIITIGTTTYTAKTELTGAAYEVLIGGSDAAFLDNLKLAINDSGVEGTNYGINTVAHPSVYATTNTDTTQKVVARVPGITPNTLPTTGTTTRISWADTTLGGGTGNSNPGVTTAGATITIGNRTYTALLQLSEASGATAIADQILWVTSEAVFLDNVKKAVNGSGIPGTDYSTGTSPHQQVQATTNANDSQVFVAKEIGTASNSIATTDTLANYAFGATTLGSGTGSTGKVICNTITASAVATTGERVIDLGQVAFSTGLLAIIGGTADLTIVYR